MIDVDDDQAPATVRPGGRGRWTAKGWRRRVLVAAVVFVVLLIIGAVSGGRPAKFSLGISPRYVAADGVVVDCAAVGGGLGLPDHAELHDGAGVWKLPATAGRYRLWWISDNGTVVQESPVETGAEAFLAPSGAQWGVAVPGVEVPHSSAARWVLGPKCSVSS